MFGLDPGLAILLVLCVMCVCAFEFVNGFHDTANAVATVIYTKSLKPMEAVVLSGALNFLGVMTGGVAVAMGIVKLMPLEALTDQSVYQVIAMVLSILFSAILWNLGTWYYGIPCSSSHTLLASILGSVLTFTLLPEGQDAHMDWAKAAEIGLSLLLSPLVGFLMTMLFMLIFKIFVKDKTIFKEPESKKKTPGWVRGLLIATCSGVSFAHGSNDGQKGVGLLLLILIAIVPAKFALNDDLNLYDIRTEAEKTKSYITLMSPVAFKSEDAELFKKAEASVDKILKIFKNADSSRKEITANEKVSIRKALVTINKNFEKLEQNGYKEEFDKLIVAGAGSSNYSNFKSNIKVYKSYTEYVPNWALVLISLSLGIGTTIGWKRIVVTIGEKIGKQHLTYAQGASAELSAATTIAFSTFVMKLPVSTTQILSSGIAGSMVASRGVGNLKVGTLKSIALAWILTFPVCVLLSGTLFYIFRLLA